MTSDGPRRGDPGARPASLAASIFTVATGRAVAQVFSVAIIPLITRTFRPRDYAVWAVTSAAAAVLGSVACLRFDLAIVVTRTGEEAAALFWLSIALAFATTASVAGVIASPTARSRLAAFASLDDPSVLWFVPPLVFLIALLQVLQAWCTKEGAFGVLALSVGATSLLGPVSQVVLGVAWQPSASALLLGNVVGLVISNGGTLGALKLRRLQPAWSRLDRRGLARLAGRNAKFVFHSTPYALLGALRDKAVLWILPSFLTVAETGAFALAQKVTMAPVTMTSSVLRPVFFQRAARHGVRSLEREIGFVHRVLAVGSVPVLLAIALEPRGMFGTVFGSQWEQAGPMASLLAWPAYAFLLSNWMDRFLDVMGKQHVAMVLEVIFSSLVLVGVVAGGAVGSKDGAILGFSSANFAYNIVSLVVVLRLADMKGSVFPTLRLAAVFAGGGTLAVVVAQHLASRGAAIATFAGVSLACVVLVGMWLRSGVGAR